MAEFKGKPYDDDERGSTSGQDKQFSPSSVPHNLRPTTLNDSKDMYWFAHAGESSGQKEEAGGSPVRHAPDDAAGDESPDSSKTTPVGRGALSPGGHSDSYWFAHAGGGYDTTTPSVDLASDSGFSESKEDQSPQAIRDRELRLRQYKELQEEDRLRRLSELQNASIQAQRFREQQEEERKRKIDELRTRDVERRHAVEERKRLIWEAEQERKEAILRRNLEREAKIEARRNAHRNSMSFAFGSSTPRELDLPLGSNPVPAPGMTPSRGSTFGSMMSFPTNTPPIDLYKRRAPSADVLDKKSDLSPGSFYYYENDTPEVQMRFRDPDNPSSQFYRRSFAGMSSEGTRACLTIPEYSLSLSPFYSSQQAPTDSHHSNTDVWLFGSGVGDPMTRSLVILPSNRGRRKTDLTPTIPWERETSLLRSHSPASIGGGAPQAKRAVSMSRLDILAQPRRRPSANMDSAPQVTTTSSSSMMAASKSLLNLAKPQALASRGGVPIGGGKNASGLGRNKGGGMSRSMLYIARPPSSVVPRVSPKVVANPVVPSPRPLNRSTKRLSQSMCQLAGAATPVPPPRPTRASRLRATAMASGTSASRDQTTDSPSTAGLGIRLPVSEGLQKESQSPSRPRSSQSMASELSVSSTVSMRSQTGPRRTRPISIAGSIVPANPEAGQVQHPLPPQRRSRTAERKVPVVPVPTRPPRAKSVGHDVLVPVSTTPKVSPPSSASRKPPLPPKPESASKIESADNDVSREEILLPEAEPIVEPSASPQETAMAVPNADSTPPPKEASPEHQPQPPPQQQQVVQEESKEGTPAGGKTRITSEEEAKAALAEKRRLAREQAEREAEAERLRQEELRYQEEERIRLEEEEQQRFEEEQLRLAQELRQQEEEKLRRAIEEQQKREEEEKARKEEENRMRAEKEEQERKLREEGERQKKEMEEKMEEKLRQEEVARAERKKRVEQIMKRTRTKNEGMAQKVDDLEKSSDTLEEASKITNDITKEPAPLISMDSDVGTDIDLLPSKESENIVPQADRNSPEIKISDKTVNGVDRIVDSDVTVVTELPATQNGFQENFVIVQNGISGKAKMASDSEDVSPQTNGYSSHDVSFSEISPEEKPQPALGALLDFDLVGVSSVGGSQQQQRGSSPPPPPTEFDQLIDLSLGTPNQNEMNRLNNSDELNSNRVMPTNPFIAFEENVTRKQESAITDLLS